MPVLAATVQQTRKQQGWSQATLAVRAGVSRPTVARIESGHDIGTASLGRIATALALHLQLVPAPPMR